MTSRRALILTTALCCAVMSSIAAAATPPPCTTISDRSGDESRGATGPDARLDVLSTQSWVAAGKLSSRIRVRDLKATALPSSTGVQYQVAFARAGERYELTSNIDVAGTTFVAHLYGGEGTSEVAPPGGDIPIEGVIDTTRSTISLTVPVQALGALRPLSSGSQVSSMAARASRWVGTYPTGGVVSSADATTSRSYMLGRSC